DPTTHTFTIEASGRTALPIDEVQSKLGGKSGFGKAWRGYTPAEKTEIVDRICTEEDDDVLKNWLIEKWSVTEKAADWLTRVNFPTGYGRTGPTATTKILAALETDVMAYSDAVQRAGYHHSDFRPGERLPRLPYYGKILTHEVMPP